MSLITLSAVQPLGLNQEKTDCTLKCDSRRKRGVISNSQIALEPYDGQRIGLQRNRAEDFMRCDVETPV